MEINFYMLAVFIAGVVIGIIVVGFIASLYLLGDKDSDYEYELPKCNCKDVNTCTTWCRPKQRFHENPPD